MKTLLVGIGAAGNKAIMNAVSKGVAKEDDTIMINSTSKDFPKIYKGKMINIAPQSGSDNEGGCGKEREIAKGYAITAIKSGKLALDKTDYTTIICVTSVEGGTGSGSTPIIAKYFNQVFRKNVHVIAFTGFETDPRGLANTVQFFQEIDSNLIVHAISNKKFLDRTGNIFKAEQAANDEMNKRISIITGQDLIDSDQNMDDTDILKVSNTAGYMTAEKMYLDKSFVDQDDFNKHIKKMIYESKSIKSNGATRIGVILNIDPASEDAVDYSFTQIKESYGCSYEVFLQKQWDGKQEYVAFIVSGMQMPLEELEAIHQRYLENSNKVLKTADGFFKAIQDMELQEEDKKFDMIRPAQSSVSVDDFLASLETK